jgi:hypothetical protein
MELGTFAYKLRRWRQKSDLPHSHMMKKIGDIIRQDLAKRAQLGKPKAKKPRGRKKP